MTRLTRTDWFTVDHNGDDDFEVLVSFEVTPVIPATYWQPEEGGEIELLSAEDGPGFNILDQLSEAAQADIRDQITNSVDRYTDDGPDPDDERDRRIDAQLTGAGQ